MKQVNKLILSAVILCFALSANSSDLVEFDTKEELARYKQLIFELRCPKCQNQNLMDSNSQISIDLRKEVELLIREGKNDDEIRTSMVALYGDFILYRPPVQNNTLVLWGGPIVMLGLGILIFGAIIYRRSKLGDDFDDDLYDLETLNGDEYSTSKEKDDNDLSSPGNGP